MKVLMVTTSYPDYEGSNRGIFIRRLCRELVNQGVEVVVLTPRIFSQSPLFEEEQGIRVYRFRFPSGNRPLNQIESVPVFAMFIYMASGLVTALRLIMKEKPDVIHGNWIVPAGLIAALAGFLTQTPVINTARGMDVRMSEKGPVRLLFDLAVRLSQHVTVVSEAMRSRPSLSAAEVISSGVDEAFFRIAPNRSSKTVLHTRALEKVYDVETLIRAVPLVIRQKPEAHFVIAGTGSHEQGLKGMAHDLGVAPNVDFMGAVSHETIAKLIEQASVYVSSATADGTSIALMEAMAAGLLPVVSDIEANRLLVDHGRDGYLFSPGDEKDLSQKLLDALSAGILPQTLEKKRKKIKGMICWNSVAKRFMCSYNRLGLGTRPGGH
ncbi:MAG: glycosyltransferase family 4 protein [Bacteriovoracaceae bacterium]|jgi:glycosyltransferase involved in cell wall biosynthesis|nr:glycosyltransferase [Pseudomonadota bacterium]NLW68071.1 glycosyltransferase family 4 protein [Bacteriovoracaceae bacterium]